MQAMDVNNELLLDLVRDRKQSEFVAYFPQFTKDVAEIENKYNDFLRKIEKFLTQNEALSQKEFALKARKRQYPKI